MRRMTVPAMASAVLVASAAAAGSALAQATGAGDPAVPPSTAWVALADPVFYSNSLKALAILFVLSVLIESALAVIFNWRLFLQLFHGRGVRTLVMIAVSALVVWTFKIDVVQSLMRLYGAAPDGETDVWLSRWLTALIVAGGSAGVFRILVKLGYRQETTPEQVAPKPEKNKAWVSVRTIRNRAVGPIYVRVSDLGPVNEGSPASLAGIISTQGFWRTVWSVFFLDRTRFPAAGGHSVTPGHGYQLEVTAMDAQGNVIAADINGTYSFAAGAIIDFVATL